MRDQVTIQELETLGGCLQVDVCLDAGSLDGEKLVKPMDVAIDLAYKQSWLLIKGHGQGEVEMVCDRCGRAFVFPVKVQWEEGVEVTDETDLPEELDLTMDQAHERMHVADVIDLADMARQQVLLALPSKRLCQESCENTYLANPAKRSIDPRWAALEALKKDHEKRGE